MRACMETYTGHHLDVLAIDVPKLIDGAPFSTKAVRFDGQMQHGRSHRCRCICALLEKQRSACQSFFPNRSLMVFPAGIDEFAHQIYHSLLCNNSIARHGPIVC